MDWQTRIFWAGLVFIALLIGGQFLWLRHEKRQAQRRAALLARAVAEGRLRLALQRAALRAVQLGFSVRLELPGVSVRGPSTGEAADQLVGTDTFDDCIADADGPRCEGL